MDKDFNNHVSETNEEDESVAATADDIIESTGDFMLKELSKNLKGYDLEEFVADLLRAMGYRTTVSPHGGDSGIDIIQKMLRNIWIIHLLSVVLMEQNWSI